MNLGNDRDFLIRVVSQCLPVYRLPAQPERSSPASTRPRNRKKHRYKEIGHFERFAAEMPDFILYGAERHSALRRSLRADYSSFARSASPLSGWRYAGATSKTVLQPVCPLAVQA